jgi:hypothetical protein
VEGIDTIGRAQDDPRGLHQERSQIAIPFFGDSTDLPLAPLLFCACRARRDARRRTCEREIGQFFAWPALGASLRGREVLSVSRCDGRDERRATALGVRLRGTLSGCHEGTGSFSPPHPILLVRARRPLPKSRPLPPARAARAGGRQRLATRGARETLGLTHPRSARIRSMREARSAGSTPER